MALDLPNAPARSASDGPAKLSASEAPAQIDGFHLVIEALKLNGIDTIFGLPGIPITDLTRMAQAEAKTPPSVRFLTLRHSGPSPRRTSLPRHHAKRRSLACGRRR